MAEMIPPELPDHASAGERATFAALQDMPEDLLVYYEPIIKRRYPDFVVLDRENGVLVIEVKGWRAGWLIEVTNDQIRYRLAGQERVDNHPLRQARNYQNRLMRLCREHPYGTRLLRSKDEPRFAFRFGHLAILTGATRAELEELGVDAFFPRNSTICSDEWQAIRAAGPEAVGQALHRAFDAEIPAGRISDDQLAVLRSIIHPVTVIPPVNPSATDQAVQDLRLLDYAQERFARDMRSGHRVIYGVAGSGKTLILIARARLLSEDTNRRILVLCFNRGLADYLSGLFATSENVTVSTFGLWATGQGTSPNDDHEAFGNALLERLLRGDGDSGRFDAVLIDEGQDFTGSWFKCAVASLKDPLHSDLVIAFDRSQNLYRRPSITWSRLGINVMGGGKAPRALRLGINYRNTYEIVSAAASFALAPTSPEDDLADAVLLDRAACQRRGAWPRLCRCNSRSSQIAEVIGIVRELSEKSAENGRKLNAIAPSEMLILYPRNDNGFADELRQRLAAAGLATIKVTTIHGSKGLQARAVILVGADQLPSHFPHRDDAEERALLYVALTRAEELLYVVYDHDTPFIGELTRNVEQGAHAQNFMSEIADV